MEMIEIGIALLIGICLGGFYVIIEMLKKILEVVEKKQHKRGITL